jgi:pimeloyl-ACP methyl ester carboxylesterase
MTAATQTATPGRRLPQPVRTALHWMLLRGLRAPRLPHAPNWTDGIAGGRGVTPFQVRGARGQDLAAWLALPRTACAARPVSVVVAVHGWGANGSTMAAMVDPLVRAGIAVVLFDAASHGDSSAEAFSSLPRFAEDLAAVLNALRGHPAIDAARVGLLGHSVGAAAVLLHTARQGGVRAVVSLSAFAHPREVMERWLQEHHIPRRWVGAAILEHVQEVIGERFDHIAPQHQLAHIACPVLLVHGEQDRTVPLADAHRLHALLRCGELLVVEGDHDLRVALAPHAEQLVRFFSTRLEAIACACSKD